jgi:hypothetical protein
VVLQLTQEQLLEAKRPAIEKMQRHAWFAMRAKTGEDLTLIP